MNSGNNMSSLKEKILFKAKAALIHLLVSLLVFTGIAYVNYISAEFSTEIFRMPAVIYLSRLFETAIIMFVLVLISQGMIYRVITKLKWYDVLNARE